MASNPPPFQVEDNTDEDFFDKLVNDDDDLNFNVTATATHSASVDPEFTDGNESDDAKAFANLSFNDLVNSSKVEKDSASSSSANDFDNLSTDVEHKVGTAEKIGNPLVSVDSFEFDNFSHIHENGNGLPNMELASKTSIGGLSDTSVVSHSDIGSGAPAVKQVDWSAFHSDSAQSSGNGFGSYSDFFSELEVANADDPIENVVGNDLINGPDDPFENVVGNDLIKGPQVASVSDVHASAFVESSSNTVQYYEENNYVATANQSSDVQDLSSIQQWEDMYPGWKFDPITGQWYQVEEHDAAARELANVESDVPSTWGVAEKQTEVSYLQQGAHSVAGIATENGTIESVTSWNQASQTNNASDTTAYWNQVSQLTDDKSVVQSDWNQASTQNNGYPPNMVFDPQYPDYYYDTLSQDWKTLESYTASIGSTARVQGQPNQNEVTSVNSYSQNSGKKDSNQELYNTDAQDNIYSTESQNQIWVDSKNHTQQRPGMWRPDPVTSAEPTQRNEPHLVESQYVQKTIPPNYGSQQNSAHYREAVPSYQNTTYIPTTFSAPSQHQSFDVNGRYSQQFNDASANQHGQNHASYDYYNNQNAVSFSNQMLQNSQTTYDPAHGRSSAGRPAHALVAFGFGGKLIVMKYSGSENLSFGNQKSEGNSVSVLNLMEVVNEKIDASDHGMGVCNYFQALGRQSVPGPLTGGSVSTKELNKWIDDRIAKPEPAGLDYREAESLRMLLSLLKISCQYYGKLRSPYGADTVLKDNDAPESALAKLFASAKNSSSQFNQYGATGQCLKQMPSEGQMRATGAEVQSLLVSGRKREALECAQEGHLWGLALVLAAQLGDQFYADTVKQMALRQLVAGSPLRTLCLLIAGQPADVFSADTLSSSMPGIASIPQQQSQSGANCLLDDWEENLAVITANRTKDDQFVLMNLGDELWKADNINAAHICYLVGEVNFDPFSDSARFCLIGANHWKYPRSYASPEAIQMTEIFEYSKSLANSQFVLLPFQPYKLVYAHMLAEVGRVSEALKYSQALLRSLKIGRTPEVENLRNLASSLEERIKAHQQGGFSTNLDPKKIVHKLRNFLVGGGLPPPVPTPGGAPQSNDNYYQPGPRVSSSQSTLTMSSLVSPSMEPMNDTNASDRFVKHSRSVSEPDFLRSPRQGQTEASSTGSQDKASATGTTSRFRSFGFGSQFLQKTVGLVLRRNDRQAKLGEQNKFYYDEKLKRWVEEGAAAPAEEAVLPPPPTTAVFQNGTSDYNFKSALQSQASHSNGSPEFKMAASPESNTGMPPLPPTSNQFSARGRAGGLGARSRYVDTFNKNSAPTANLFQSPPAPSLKPATGSNPKFFVPASAPVSSNTEQLADTPNDNMQETSTTYQNSPSGTFQSPTPSSIPMQRFASMNNIKEPTNDTGSFSVNSRRTASWSGSSFNNSFSPPHRGEVKPLGEQLGIDPSSFVQNDPSLVHSSSYGDDLHEVEL